VQEAVAHLLAAELPVEQVDLAVEAQHLLVRRSFAHFQVHSSARARRVTPSTNCSGS
jgi:hypothetical protein